MIDIINALDESYLVVLGEWHYKENFMMFMPKICSSISEGGILYVVYVVQSE